jgi:hypothetical protein
VRGVRRKPASKVNGSDIDAALSSLLSGGGNSRNSSVSAATPKRKTDLQNTEPDECQPSWILGFGLLSRGRPFLIEGFSFGNAQPNQSGVSRLQFFVVMPKNVALPSRLLSKFRRPCRNPNTAPLVYTEIWFSTMTVSTHHHRHQS